MGLFRIRRKINLISREITKPRADLRMECGIPESDLVVYLGLGKSLGSAFLRRLKDNDSPGIRFLVSAGIELPNKNVIHIPEGEVETQNYIAMCDLVVSKAGYSTASEAIKARVPTFLFRRAGYEEDKLIARGVESMGIGKEISGEQFLNLEWSKELDNLEQYRSKYDGLAVRFKEDGLTEAVDAIEEAVL
jgi:UDP:flavonoid glycosyltransferase YjiC (YdhE family)